MIEALLAHDERTRARIGNRIILDRSSHLRECGSLLEARRCKGGM